MRGAEGAPPLGNLLGPQPRERVGVRVRTSRKDLGLPGIARGAEEAGPERRACHIEQAAPARRGPPRAATPAPPSAP